MQYLPMFGPSGNMSAADAVASQASEVYSYIYTVSEKNSLQYFRCICEKYKCISYFLVGIILRIHFTNMTRDLLFNATSLHSADVIMTSS